MSFKFETSGVIKVAILGFLEDDIAAVQKIVTLSQRRPVKLSLLPAAQFFEADVLLINNENIDKNRFDSKQWLKINSLPIISIVKKVDDDTQSASYQLDNDLIASKVVHRPVEWEMMLLNITEVYLSNKQTLNKLVLNELAFDPSGNSSQVTNSSDFEVVSVNTTNPQVHVTIPFDKPVKNNGKKILLVDDSESVRKYLSGYMFAQGYDVITCVDGRNALDVFYSKPIDTVLLDIVLPDIDGYKVCKEMKKKNKELPVVFLTAKTTSIDRFWGKMAGCDAYLTKPVTADVLFDTIEKLLTH